MTDKEINISFTPKILFKKVLPSLLSLGAGTLVAFLFHLFYAKVMGAHHYGAFSFWFSMMNLMGFIACLGLNRIALRFIPLYQTKNNHRSSSGLFITSMFIGLALVIILSFTSFLLLPLVFEHTRTTHPILYYGLWLLPLFVLVNLNHGFLRGFGMASFTVFATNFLMILFALLLSILLFDEAGRLTGLKGVIALGAAVGVIAAIQLSGLALRVPRHFLVSKPQNDFKVWFKTAFPMFMSSISYYGFIYINPIIINLLIGEKETGLYFIVLQISSIIYIPQYAIVNTISRYIPVLHEQSQHKKLQLLVNSASKIIIVFCGLLFLLVISFGKLLLDHLGSEYSSAYGILVFVAIIQLLISLSGISSTLLNLTEYQWLDAKIFSAGLLLNIAGCVILLPILGLYGAAIAYLVSQLMILAASYINVRKKLKINSFYFFN